MPDYSSELPIRTQLPGQSLPDDVIIKIGDGTNPTTQLGTVLPASTAASATDTALVVAFSPNSPLPAGSATIGAVTQASGPWTQNLTEVGGSAIALGQTTMTASLPVSIASDQSPIPVTQSTSPWVVSGTVAVTQSTSPWVTSDTSDGSVTGGTAGTTSMLGGGQYNTTLPTLTNTQQSALQLDVNGNLKVDLATPIPAGTNAIGSVLANLQVSNAPVTVSNPIPVTITSGSAGTPIQNFTDLASIAAGGNATATYTIPATHSFSLERVFVSAENRIKIIVANNGATIFTAFSSSANPNIDITVTAPPTIIAGNAITVQVFNIDHGTSDAYVTIEGNQIT